MNKIIKTLICITLLCSPQAYAKQSTQSAFSPSPQAIKLVQNTIGKAEKTIEVAAYSFASGKVSDALIEAHNNGVVVRVVLDKTHAKRRYPAVLEMLDAGIEIRINRKYAIMHNKYMIIDGKTIETGSFNYSTNAEKKNAENVIVINNNKPLAKKYMKDWQRLWDESEEYQ